uniref:Uncharacterized protein n=1 Tax=Cyprinus carpio TaxID=7962 RepID=A0A8C1P834_CYPCA
YYLRKAFILYMQLFCLKLYNVAYDIFVKIGETLKLDVLLPDAHQVMHQNKSSTEWKKVWKRDSKKRVKITHDRLNDTDGTLSIKEFMADDAGTYRVLGYEGEILITVTVTDEKNHWGVFGPAGLFVFALLFLILIAAIIKKMQ